MFRKKVEEKINTHFVCSPPPENRAVYDIVSKKYCTASQSIDENIKWRIRIACWILNATNTDSEK